MATPGYDADIDIGRGAMRRVEVIEVDDRDGVQMVKVMGLADEIFEFPYRGQPFGLTTVPTVGSIGYAFLAAGRPDQCFLMGLEHPDQRPKGRKEGESIMYAKKQQRVEMDDAGNVLIKSPNGIVHINPA